MPKTLKRTRNEKQQDRVRNLKPVKAVKGSGKILHALEHQETDHAKELKKLWEEVRQINSDIAHILEALQTLEMWVPTSRAEIPQFAWAYRKFLAITSRLRQEARSR